MIAAQDAFVAQLVEQRTENPRVVGSIPTGGICGFSSFGRARPCQGRGGGFEPRNPLQKTRSSERVFLSNLTGLVYHHALARISSTRFTASSDYRQSPHNSAGFVRIYKFRLYSKRGCAHCGALLGQIGEFRALGRATRGAVRSRTSLSQRENECAAIILKKSSKTFEHFDGANMFVIKLSEGYDALAFIFLTEYVLSSFFLHPVFFFHFFRMYRKQLQRPFLYAGEVCLIRICKLALDPCRSYRMAVTFSAFIRCRYELLQ